MARARGPTPFRFPTVRPAVPVPEDWLPYLRESYERHWFTNFGPVATRFEAALAAQFGEAGDAFVAASSATAALTACLIAEGVRGTVLLPAFTFPASAAAIRMAEAEPALIDVDPASWACDLASLERGLDRTGATAAMLVAPFGITQDFTRHVALCEARGVVVVVDNAAGLGGGGRARRALRGTAYEVYSLHATKPFALGEGGAIQCPKDRVERLRSALNFGLPWSASRPGGRGINGKMPEISAAIGMAVLADYADTLVARRRQARRYIEMMARFDGVTTPRGLGQQPWQVFPCLMPKVRAADAFTAALVRRGLEARRYYRPSLSRWGGIAVADDCPVSEDLAERMVCLPIYSDASQQEIAEMHEIVEASMGDALGVSARRRAYVSAA
ncbi:MAG TPA: DegT/DnrJ/EryC1/StrS family aminotransferase [Stellaceae bacterium]|jgi:dTDP-4-amino-4,6-dideoxygalactose transaminase|nr:DegT/DnrJ/EryC1/StrS family aminotransferase [Stellaceae bacterium]